jgi:hypothetical protein
MKTTSMKQFAVTLFAASAVTLAPAFALGTAELQKVSKSVASSKVVEIPAVAAKYVKNAAKADRQQVAVAVVISAVRAYPSSVGPVVTAVLKTAPETANAVVAAALEAAPESSLTIVSAAVQGAPQNSDLIVAAASTQMPARAAAFEREAAVVRGRRSLGGSAAFGDTGTKTINLGAGGKGTGATENNQNRGGVYGSAN